MYVVSGLSTRLIPEWIDKIVLLVLAQFLSGVAELLIGPSSMFSFPDNPYIMAGGLFLAGTCGF